MKVTVETKDVGNVKERFSRDFKRQLEDLNEKYIKLNLGIEE